MESTAQNPTVATTVALADAVRAALGDAYARPIVVEQGDHVAVLAGKPLELAAAAIARTHGADAAARIVELDVSTLAWQQVPVTGLRLWRQHGRRGADGELVTDLEAGDPPVRVVVEDSGWSLLRLVDGAQGWIESGLGRLEPGDAPQPSIADASRIDVDAFVAELLAFEGVPYVWGGTTDAGVDCSGIVQRAAWRAGGCWLPRHSRALLRAGARVKPSAVERGDVLVLQRDPSTYEAERRAQLEALAAEEARTGSVPAHGPAIHPMHVAVCVGPNEVLHASRDEMRVVREPLDGLRARYRVLGVRRFGPVTEAEDEG